MNNMTVRILFAVVAIPAFIGLLYAGEVSRKLLLMFLAVGASWEFARGLTTLLGKPSNTVVTPLITAIVLASWLCPSVSFEKTALVSLPLVLLVYILLAFKSVAIEKLFPWIALHLFGLLFFGYWFGLTFQLMGQGAGFSPVLTFLFICFSMWICDSGAYFVGVSIGKHKFAPQISPKKSWEGSIGGVVLTLVFGYFAGSAMTELSTVNAVVLSFILAVTAQIGDLFMSAFKRYTGTKDSSNIFPGHGGIIDRFDSLFLAAPVAVIWIEYAGKLF